MKRKLPLLSVMAAMLLAACQSKEVDYLSPAANSDKLVVFCFFSPDSVWSVHVSRLAGVMDIENELNLTLSHANVELYEANRLLEILEYDEELACYRSPEGLKPEYGKKYHLEVNCENYKPVVSALESLPDSVQITRIDYYESIPKNEFPLDVYRSDSYAMVDVRMIGHKGQLFNTRRGYSLSNTSKRYFNDYLTDCRLLESTQPGEILLRMTVNKEESDDILLRTISPSCFLHEMSYLEYDMVTFTTYLLTPNNIYSNIQGGCGMFAGYTEYKLMTGE